MLTALSQHCPFLSDIHTEWGPHTHLKTGMFLFQCNCMYMVVSIVTGHQMRWLCPHVFWGGISCELSHLLSNRSPTHILFSLIDQIGVHLLLFITESKHRGSCQCSVRNREGRHTYKWWESKALCLGVLSMGKVLTVVCDMPWFSCTGGQAPASKYCIVFEWIL